MKTIGYILIGLLLLSCYDNKGSYNYQDINEVLVDLKDVYEVKIKDTVLTIRPELSQTLKENRENLKFTWLYSNISSAIYGRALDTISTEDYMTFKIDPSDPDLKYEHYFRLNVYDEETGLEYFFNTKVKLVKPYQGAWMLLHRQNNVTKLGTVEYIGREPMVTNDAYFQETGRHLKGNPLCLGVNYYAYLKYYGIGEDNNIFFIATDEPDEAGIYCQWERFKKVDSLSRMVAPNYRGTFDYKNVNFFEAATYGVIDNVVCVAGGVLYQIPEGMKFYQAYLEPKITGEINISHGATIGYISILYDQAGRRFMYYNNLQYTAVTDPNVFNEERDNPSDRKAFLIPQRDLNVAGIDPCYVSSDMDVAYVGTGYYHDQQKFDISCYSLARSLKKDSCYVYDFRYRGMSSADYASLAGFYALKTPEGLNTESCFASSVAYNGIMFYSSGDKVYRLDFTQSGGKAIPIYSHPGGKAKVMKFAYSKKKASKMNYVVYGHELARSLGIVFEMSDGTCDFVVLNLSVSGKVDGGEGNWPSTQVYSGFGAIKDIVFL